MAQRNNHTKNSNRKHVHCSFKTKLLSEKTTEMPRKPATTAATKKISMEDAPVVASASKYFLLALYQMDSMENIGSGFERANN